MNIYKSKVLGSDLLAMHYCAKKKWSKSLYNWFPFVEQEITLHKVGSLAMWPRLMQGQFIEWNTHWGYYKHNIIIIISMHLGQKFG